MKFADWKTQKNDAANPQNKNGANDSLVNQAIMQAGKGELLLIKPNLPGMNLADWIVNHQDRIDAELLEHGAILMRGFHLHEPQQFQNLVAKVMPQQAAYVEGATPRTRLQGGVYTSTEFPRDQEIAPHNELSYVTHPPSRIAFCCIQPAESGGQTQLVDVHKVHQSLPAELLLKFEQAGGWLLQRNYQSGVGNSGFGPTLEKAFGMPDPQTVSEYCQRVDIEFIDMGDNQYRTRQKRQAVHLHPISQLPLWFNHIAFWHVSSLCPKVRAQMHDMLALEDFPFGTYFADGEAIDEQDIVRIRQAYQDHEILFDWQKGDLLLLDNWRIAHGRKPFTGERQVLVAMS